MPSLLALGAAILDLVYVLDELPVTPEKHRAKSLSLQGRGSRFGGRAGIPSQNEIAKLLAVKAQSSSRSCAAVTPLCCRMACNVPRFSGFFP